MCNSRLNEIVFESFTYQKITFKRNKHLNFYLKYNVN